MHALTTIHKLNREAAEASHIINAHNPASRATSHPEIDKAIKEQRANAQATIARLTKTAA